jgi:RNA polymerase sigma factor (sigma-70 family)
MRSVEDLTPLDEARRDLVGRHLPLARRIARTAAAGRGSGDARELRSEAEFALVKAAQDWPRARPSRVTEFADHAAIRIRSRLINLYRKRARPKWAPMAPLDAEPPGREGDPARLAAARLDAAALLARLTPRQRLAVELIVMGGLSLTEAGAAAGVTGVTAYLNCRLGLERLRRSVGTG